MKGQNRNEVDRKKYRGRGSLFGTTGWGSSVCGLGVFLYPFRCARMIQLYQTRAAQRTQHTSTTGQQNKKSFAPVPQRKPNRFLQMVTNPTYELKNILFWFPPPDSTHAFLLGSELFSCYSANSSQSHSLITAKGKTNFSPDTGVTSRGQW